MTGIFSAGERIRAERQLAAVLKTHPDLMPEGFTSDHAPNEDWINGDTIQEKYVRGFHWARHFLILGCRRLSSTRSRKSTSSDRLKDLAEDAAETAIDRQVDIQQGVLIAAALSLEIDIERDWGGPGALLAVRAAWRSGR